MKNTQVNNDLGKIPPQAVDLEEAVLGALILERDSFPLVADILRPDIFYRDAHKEIFTAINELLEESKPVDTLTITQHLRTKGKLEFIGGAHYIATITNKVNSSTNIEYHARILQEKYIKREIIRTGSEMQKKGFNDYSDALDLLSDAIKNLSEIVEQTNKRKAQSLKENLDQSLNQILDAYNSDHHITGIPSGFIDLDQITHGWQNSDLIILAARPSMGKTALAVRFLANAGIKSQIPCVFFSLEMSSLQLTQRIQAGQSGISLEKIRSGDLSSDEYTQLKSISKKIESAPVFIDDTPSLRIIELRSKIYNLIIKYGIKFVLIDYIQLMSSEGNNRYEEVGKISRGLKAVAKEFNIPIIALSQLNRAVENRQDRRPQLSDLRESGDIEQDADLAMLLFRPEYYGMENDSAGNSLEGICEVLIRKHRNGRTKDINLIFDGQTQMFYNYSKQAENSVLDFGQNLSNNGIF